jgi:hypothetical protein
MVTFICRVLPHPESRSGFDCGLADDADQIVLGRFASKPSSEVNNEGRQISSAME